MSKRPAFQFYPSDWRTDQDLRMCSAGARSLWIDMLCLMHEGEPYGHLTAKGHAMPADALARLTGEGVAAVRRWLTELREHGVFSETADGVIYSRRMVRDEQVRDARAAGGPAGAEHGAKGAEHGAKGGRPRKDKGGSEVDGRGDNKPPLKPPPSSSSSTSSSVVPLPVVKAEPSVSGQAASRKGERLRADWLPSGENVAYAIEQGFTAAQVERIAEDFRDFWSAKTGADAAKLDWSATWRRWVRNTDPRKVQARTAQAKRVGFV